MAESCRNRCSRCGSSSSPARGAIEVAQHLLTGTDRRRFADQAKTGAAVVDLNTQTALDQPQVFIKQAAEIRQPLIVLGLQQQIEGFRVF